MLLFLKNFYNCINLICTYDQPCNLCYNILRCPSSYVPLVFVLRVVVNHELAKEIWIRYGFLKRL